METFFYGIDPVIQSLYIDGIPFTIVGLFSDENAESIASLFSGSPDILIPYTTALKMNSESLVISFVISVSAIALGVGFSAAVGDHLRLGPGKEGFTAQSY